MASDTNPYEPPDSLAYRPAPPMVIDIRANWLAAISNASDRALYTGAAWCAGALAAPFALRWHACNVLRQTGEEHMVENVIDQHVAPLDAGFIVLAVISMLLVMTGRRIRRFDVRALYASAIVCGVLAADMIRRMLANPDEEPAFRLVPVAWLVYAAAMALKTSWQKRGEPGESL